MRDRLLYIAADTPGERIAAAVVEELISEFGARQVLAMLRGALRSSASVATPHAKLQRSLAADGIDEVLKRKDFDYPPKVEVGKEH
jgi:hypothetical protein